jgi:hypothetical protein
MEPLRLKMGNKIKVGYRVNFPSNGTEVIPLSYNKKKCAHPLAIGSFINSRSLLGHLSLSEL